ncbi:MAG TPA: class I SAM-dependent methyltransferase [Bryobacteraceae bacterium]|nr:class I SAM-dependent methyltransferase [Bryobacteraceae bacterium]
MDEKGEDLAAVIAEIRDRVRARNTNGDHQGAIPLPDLTPLLHARDAAEAKVASIGTVNPRPGGLKNDTIQWLKRTVARALDWHIREQVEFNRGVMECVQATIEELNVTKQALSLLAGKLNRETELLRSEANELKDIRAHWVEWRAGWEQKLSNNEIHFLRSISDLQASFHHRVALEAKNTLAQFESSMIRQNQEMQQRFWDELGKAREEYERMIHTELRLLRQRATLTQAAAQVVESAPPEFVGVDWLKFADRFRGSEDDIRSRQQMYASRFGNHSPVLDLGCGRGELIQVLQDAGIKTRGVDSHEDSIALCRSKGLEAERADLFTYLRDLPDASLGGVVCCQVIEHLPPQRLPEMIQLAHAKLRAGGLIALETPNPECLAIFATHFYIDPTHRHPIPPVLTSFYLEEAGFGRIEIDRLSPAIESMPSISELPEGFRKAFFGSLDYVALGTKLG